MRVRAATLKRSLQQQPTSDAGRQVIDIMGTGSQVGQRSRALMTLPPVHLPVAGKEDCTCWVVKHDQSILRKLCTIT